ncbi:MAG: STAS domain-containing protein [Calditrichales bacterium]|nr:STAS domain-containing protein [Calditrichales bacterium]
MEFLTKEYLEGEVNVIDTKERLTTETSDDLKILIKELVDNGKFKIVINLENTKYMDSSGLGAIVSKIAVTRSNKGDIRLAAVQEFVKGLLELTHINKILKCYDNVNMAVNSFKE